MRKPPMHPNACAKLSTIGTSPKAKFRPVTSVSINVSLQHPRQVYDTFGLLTAAYQFCKKSPHYEPRMPKIAPEAPTVILSCRSTALALIDRTPAPK